MEIISKLSSITQRNSLTTELTPSTNTRSASIKTGINRLDDMMGDIICGPLYLFYSSEKNGLQNRILYHLLIEAIKVRNTSAIHLFCGHNRNLRESINFDMLLKIIKRAGSPTLDLSFQLSYNGCYKYERKQFRKSRVEES